MGTLVKINFPSTAVSLGRNQGWQLLHNVQRDILASLVLHVHLHNVDLHLVTLLLHAYQGLASTCLVDRLLHAVPHHGVHLGAELDQRLTQGWRLLHELLCHGGLVRLLLHVGLLHDLLLVTLLLLGLPGSSLLFHFY